MSGRVLVVDDQPLNLKLLEAKLGSEYFDVVTAADGPAAIEVAKSASPDIILLDVMMPGMDGYEVCRRLKAESALSHVPVVMVTALGDVADRVRGLEAGADDFLTKPINDIALFARVRSLIRLKQLLDELRLREEAGADLEVITEHAQATGEGAEGARVIVVADDDPSRNLIVSGLRARHEVEAVADPVAAQALGDGGGVDLFIVSLDLSAVDGLRLCAQLRAAEATRNVPVLVLARAQVKNMLVKAIEIGVNDYIVEPVDRNELLARVRTQVRYKRYQDRLRHSARESIALAVEDGLTGLRNRRYLDRHLACMLHRASDLEKPMALLIVDIDHFKSINDHFGHLAGDDVLRAIARRMVRNLRASDLAARYGGEEFMVVMPDTGRTAALCIAERLRSEIAAMPVEVTGHATPVCVTASIGVTALRGGDDTAAALITRADAALYRAKEGGRNQVAAAWSADVAEEALSAQGAATPRHLAHSTPGLSRSS